MPRIELDCHSRDVRKFLRAPQANQELPKQESDQPSSAPFKRLITGASSEASFYCAVKQSSCGSSFSRFEIDSDEELSYSQDRVAESLLKVSRDRW
jgi:hypothetical protein